MAKMDKVKFLSDIEAPSANFTSKLTVDGKDVAAASDIPTSLKNPNALTFGSQTYDGSAAKTITAADLGLSGAMKFLGTSTTAISDGSTTKTITVNSKSVTAEAGNVVLYNGNEFVWDGSKWEELGHEGSFKVKQTAVSSPSASGTTTAFIDTISQDANGNIAATKKSIPSASTSAAGLMSASDKSKLDGIASGANAYTHPSYTARTGVPTANQTPAFGGTFTVTQPTSDGTGHITAMTSRTITIPNATATTLAAGLMSANDKKRVDSFAGSYNLGSMGGKTKAEFQSALDTWLNSYSNISNATACFTGDFNWCSVWNSSDTTKTISDGGIWTVTIIAKYDTKNYTQLRMSSYYDKQVVYVARTGGTWLTAHVAAFKDDLPSAAGSSLGLVKSGGDVTISSGVITVNDDSHNHVISNVDGLQGALDGKVKGDYKAATTAATAGWYRIATTPVGISNCIGIFEIAAAVSGRHTTAIITAGTSYGNPDSSTIHVLHCSQYSGNAITKARIVYHSTYASNYAYVEVYNPSATAMSLSVRLIGGTNWGLVAPNTAGSVPSGYSSKEVTLSTGTMVAGTFEGALSGNAATATKLTTSAGSVTQPVYFSDGKPVATTYTLGKSVPSDAKFTDTTYSAATTSTAGLMTAAMVTKLNGITEGADSVSFTQSATSGNKVGEITINGTKTAMYSPTQTSVSGNAGTATKFASAQSVALTGDVTGSASSQAGWSVATTLANSGVTAGSYGPSANASPAHGKTFSVPYITVDAKGRVTSASTKTITLPSYSNATTSAAGLMSSTDKSRLDQCYAIITNNLNEVAF